MWLFINRLLLAGRQPFRICLFCDTLGFTFLRVLGLGSNQLSGTIPQALSALSLLRCVGSNTTVPRVCSGAGWGLGRVCVGM